MENSTTKQLKTPTLEERIQAADRFTAFWRYRVLEDHFESHLDSCFGLCLLVKTGVANSVAAYLENLGKPGGLQVISYCLMPNHLHLLLRSTKPGTNWDLVWKDTREGLEEVLKKALESSVPVLSGLKRVKRITSTRQFRYLMRKTGENFRRSSKDGLYYNAMSGLPCALNSVLVTKCQEKESRKILCGDEQNRSPFDGKGRPVYQEGDECGFLTLFPEETLPVGLYEGWRKIISQE